MYGLNATPSNIKTNLILPTKKLKLVITIFTVRILDSISYLVEPRLGAELRALPNVNSCNLEYLIF